jgi:hypothetical protein
VMQPVPAGTTSLFGLDPADYEPHYLHKPEGRTYTETNCYADILIELIHARGDDPLAVTGFTVRMDFEGDQWTFFKPPPADVRALFGIDIHEMQPYRPLPQQIAEQIAEGRSIIFEVDSWYLPDLASTSYRREHVKTSLIAEAIDIEAERFHYFHNTSLHALEGEDYRGVFRLGRPFSDDVLPPYAELVRFDAGPRLEGEELRAAARELLRTHLAARPATNPFDRFAERLAADLPQLLEGDATTYHDYAFATVRMFGSAFEITAAHVDWLFGAEGEQASAALKRIVDGSKVLTLKLARRKPFDPEPLLTEFGEAWEQAMGSLDAISA